MGTRTSETTVGAATSVTVIAPAPASTRVAERVAGGIVVSSVTAFNVAASAPEEGLVAAPLTSGALELETPAVALDDEPDASGRMSSTERATLPAAIVRVSRQSGSKQRSVSRSEEARLAVA